MKCNTAKLLFTTASSKSVLTSFLKAQGTQAQIYWLSPLGNAKDGKEWKNHQVIIWFILHVPSYSRAQHMCAAHIQWFYQL